MDQTYICTSELHQNKEQACDHVNLEYAAQ